MISKGVFEVIYELDLAIQSKRSPDFPRFPNKTTWGCWFTAPAERDIQPKQETIILEVQRRFIDGLSHRKSTSFTIISLIDLRSFTEQ
jgi:hypothetical protein